MKKTSFLPLLLLPFSSLVSCEEKTSPSGSVTESEAVSSSSSKMRAVLSTGKSHGILRLRLKSPGRKTGYSVWSAYAYLFFVWNGVSGVKDGFYYKKERMTPRPFKNEKEERTIARERRG